MTLSYLRRSLVFLLLIAISALSLSPGIAQENFEQQREALIEEVAEDLRRSEAILEPTELDPRVLRAMKTVPRHEYVPEKHKHQAYRNRPLPIGYGQTISQPAIVALMTNLLELEPSDKVLEIGTGSGYQAAVLAELVDQVFSIEIVPELAERAARDLKRTGYNNVTTRQGDGYYGWEEQAPFDAIIVTAAADHIPPRLLKQLKPGGRMVIPVGSRFMVQHLVLVKKTEDSDILTEQLLPVQFVPLTGEH
ncbi:protein-L-isoaspartate(D-aspartate) O-methyltransferase [Methylophaga sp.]|jgi:protein-L-isoaspartate(D-aspartate) O-methyltransferase|uniref:protein-L-isoaspartate(D-aspartate) O-methyltransferase n=1 Tax=Methylophaga sp. TaxID=2024840 RepID=UPI00140000AD|nr:protein-L-isoaspartate(D-aspartate) O-methyltransferase [Methylophaga sp.]MTI64534.1 protein-L-isoaspartate(D-aspartate) O-methyltransferase [Methylophaga sp.]